MPVNIVSWNINNFSKKKGCTELYDYLASVFDWQDLHFFGLIEVVSFMGDCFGDEIGGRVNYGNTIRYQDSSQYVGHSEQYVGIWNNTYLTNVNTIDNFNYVEFPDSSQRPPTLYMMDVKITGTKKLSNVPFGVFHAPGPQKGGTYVAKGCNNISKIKEISGATAGIIMGDFNISPSNPASSYGSDAFGKLIKLGYSMQLSATKTSLKILSSVPTTATFTDCLASEYDNFFVKMPGNVTASAQVIDLISPAVKGNKAYNKNYAIALGTWHAKKDKLSPGTYYIYSSIKEAFDAYRYAVSDHLPILLQLS